MDPAQDNAPLFGSVEEIIERLQKLAAVGVGVCERELLVAAVQRHEDVRGRAAGAGVEHVGRERDQDANLRV